VLWKTTTWRTWADYYVDKAPVNPLLKMFRRKLILLRFGSITRRGLIDVKFKLSSPSLSDMVYHTQMSQKYDKIKITWILCRVLSYKLTDVSEMLTVSIFRASSPWWWIQWVRLKRRSATRWLHGTKPWRKSSSSSSPWEPDMSLRRYVGLDIF
jgi:hypothetical protein